MVTAHGESGFTFRIWPNDHEPAHVHAYQGGDLVVIELKRVTVRTVHGMKPADIKRALEIVRANRAKMLKVWRKIHD